MTCAFDALTLRPSLTLRTSVEQGTTDHGAIIKIPEGYHTITPYFTVLAADQFISFLVEAFDGKVVREKRNKNNIVQHARVRIGDTIIMLNEANENYSANVSQMHLFVLDVDATFAKALSAGATAIMEPNVRPHGDRMAGVKDPCENIWWIAAPA